MLTIETKELEMSSALKKKLEMIGRFTNTKPIIKNGCIKSISNTNMAYVMPNIITINGINYLIFDDSDDVYVNNLQNKIKFKDLETHINSNKNHYINKNINME